VTNVRNHPSRKSVEAIVVKGNKRGKIGADHNQHVAHSNFDHISGDVKQYFLVVKNHDLYCCCRQKPTGGQRRATP
jgi:hypothetical protein